MDNTSDDTHTDEYCCGTCAYAHQLETGAIEAPIPAGGLIETSQDLRVSFENGSTLVICAERATIGRSSTCDITISDPALSKLQCTLARTSEGWQITDSGSGCGTFVDGRRIASAWLHHGTEIRVGNEILLVRGA